jgi:hypothetical protein
MSYFAMRFDFNEREFYLKIRRYYLQYRFQSGPKINLDAMKKEASFETP